MTHPILTPIRFENGLWQGHLKAQAEPAISVRYRGDTLDGVQIEPADGGWALNIPVPLVALSDGVHSFVILDEITSEKLGDFTIISGSPAADDLRAEVELLRAELDMLKRAFRRVQNEQE